MVKMSRRAAWNWELELKYSASEKRAAVHCALFPGEQYGVNELQTYYLPFKKALLTCLSKVISCVFPCSPLRNAKGPGVHARMAV